MARLCHVNVLADVESILDSVGIMTLIDTHLSCNGRTVPLQDILNLRCTPSAMYYRKI